MTAIEMLKQKGLKDTLYNVEKNDGTWIAGGLSALLVEFTSQREEMAFKAGIKAAESEDFMFSTDKELFEQYQTINPLI